MIGFQRPELLLLLLPAAWFWWSTRDRELGTRVLRALALVLLVLGLASPYLSRTTKGHDLVIVVDRSRSMTDEARASARELIALAEDARREGDRVGIVTFGARAAIERPPLEESRFEEYARVVNADGSNLAEALEVALELIPEERSGSILLLSDGELRGRDAVPVARRAFGREVRIDVRPYPRPGRVDLAILRLELPEVAALGEPFQFSAWVDSSSRVTARYRLTRDGEVLAQGERLFEEGYSRLVFRDLVPAVGVATYELEVLGVDDRVPENNIARGALRVDGPRALLVVNDDGAEDSLVRALRRSGLRVDVAAPETAPIDRLGLEAYRGVILANVAADRLGDRMRDVARFVTERGGGLLVTGGKASFGIGGYYLSPLDPVLPVSMELRKEQRKQGMALAIAMDRSGSMGMHAGGGTKMDLANLGAASAIELLSELDSVAVIAVDTEPDVAQEMTRATDTEALQHRVRRIQPGGGGIYVRVALEAALVELAKAPQLSKHITLFSDAADSEQQEGCAQLVNDFVAAGVTLSVIALGTPADPDADFLRGIAELGGGEIYFTTQADELPRLFAHDTLTASRATFVDQPTAVALLPDLYGLGELTVDGFPELDGYNLTYLREGATAGAVTTDDFHAPIFAFQYSGLGRSAAFTGQIGGTYGSSLPAWDGFASFFVTASRWLLGQDPPDALFPSVRREGREAVIDVEFDPEAPAAPNAGELEALLGLEDGTTLRRSFERVDEGLYRARFPLDREGVALPSVKVDAQRSIALPPLALPYSPEFEPSSDAAAGERLLRTLAAESGGTVAPPANTLFRVLREGAGWLPITRELLIAALVVCLLEIAFRRLSLWAGVDWKAAKRKATRDAEQSVEREAARAHAGAATRAQQTPATDAPPRESEADRRTALADALSAARERAKRELDR
ncbi:MAG: VWA domain-containing protein [Planctomycetes bacterium]|nr:VWA domain-containing protein [Planctomycetota bacterium]